MSTRAATRSLAQTLGLGAIALAIGYLLMFLGAMMLLPALVDAATQNSDWAVFVATALVTGFTGTAMALATRGQGRREWDARGAFLLTTLSWVALSVFGSLPFMFSKLHLSFPDALFETVSGLTTTGSTVLVGLDHMARGILFWRSLLCWIGGIGIVVMAMIILPFLRIGGLQLFRAESSDKSEKMFARVSSVAGSVAVAYCTLTLLIALGYAAAGMPGFDAVNNAMTTIATAGYSTHDSSFAFYKSNAILWISIFSMLAGALPMTLYVQMIFRRRLSLWKESQVRRYLLYFLVVALSIAAWQVFKNHMNVGDAVTQSLFNVASIMSTTGYVSTDYSQWGAYPIAAILFVTFIGGCTGSTAGGMKFFRLEILWIGARRHALHLIRPHMVTADLYNGKPLPPDVIPSVLAFLFAFILTIVTITIGLSLCGLDFVTSLSATATAFSNVGPGFGPIIGPVGNFSSLPDAAKLLLSADMILGRLEIFTVVILFVPAFWRW
jgi:trk system potassium uptake protein TrkH